MVEYSDPFNHPFRFKPASLSDPNLPLIPIQGKPATGIGAHHFMVSMNASQAWSIRQQFSPVQDEVTQLDALRVSAGWKVDDGTASAADLRRNSAMSGLNARPHTRLELCR